MPKTYTLRGAVTDTASAPLAGVRVQAVGDGNTTPDALGTFMLTVPAGQTPVEFSKEGYQMVEKQIVISGDTQRMVMLTPVTLTTLFRRGRSYV